MRKFLLPCAVLCTLLISNHTLKAQHLNFRVNVDSVRKSISPFIYGTNQDYEHAGSKRLGGNRFTGYNWENNASDAGSDYNYELDDYEFQEQNVPTADRSYPASVISTFHNKSLNMNAYSLVTLPLAGYVAKDINGVVSPSETAPSTRWAKVYQRKGRPFSLNPNLTDDSVSIDEEINYLTTKFGRSNTSTGIKGYSLDNEPEIWYFIHPYLFGTNHLTTSYLIDQSIKTANTIKDMDPTAEVFGYASYGFFGYETLQDAPDWPAVKGTNTLFLEYYLEKMKAEEVRNGRRLLDVLDLHWYPEKDLTLNSSPDDDLTDYASNKVRMDRVRSLWDNTYVENTWIGKEHPTEIFPVLKKLNDIIDNHYPGTKLGITEYSYMGINHPSGAIAEADALGVYGKYSLYFATYWGLVQNYIKTGLDLYKNYDGKGGTFGDVSVGASSEDTKLTSVYASAESADTAKLHIVALNKDQDSSHLVTVSLGGHINYKSALVYMFDNSSSQIKQLKNIRVISNNSFQILMPPVSGFHIVATTEDLSVYPYIDSLTTNINSSYADGKTVLHIEAKVSDGDNNITSVAVDLSQIGGSATQTLTSLGGKYILDYIIPTTSPSGLRSLRVTVLDATAHMVYSDIPFRIILKVPPLKLWDGDVVGGGNPYIYFDNGDSKSSLLKMEVLNTGGNVAPLNLHMYSIHDPYKWNQFCWRFAPNPFSPRDVSNYAYLEFYIRSNGPAFTDLDISLQDVSAAQNNSNTVSLKANNYISSYNDKSYTRVRIPFSDFTSGIPFDLTKLWQINFHTNTAAKGFDIWIDDITAIPWTLPSETPVINTINVSPTAGYSDGNSKITITATASDPDDNLKGIYADLSSLSGKNDQALSLNNGTYSFNYTVPTGLLKGPKKITVYALDDTGNEKDTSLYFNIYQKSTTDTIWNGDNYKFGSAWESNIKTKCLINPTGGNYSPGSMKCHLQPFAPDPWSGIVWDWNDGSNDNNIQDMSNKRYFSFYLKVPSAPTNFDVELKLKDLYANESNPILIKGDKYVTSFTGNYQHILIPLDKLFTLSTIDPSNVTRFVLTSSILPATGVDVFVDDITTLGSSVAEVFSTVQDANCGNNGQIKIDNINAISANYNYYLNGLANPNGISNPLFNSLSPTAYDVKITGDNNFVFLQTFNIRGFGPLNVTPVIANGNNINVSVAGGSGHYGYLWQNGLKTPNLTNVPNGNYTVSVTDSISGCKVNQSILVSGALPLTLSSFTTAAINKKQIKINWVTSSETDIKGFDLQRSEGGGAFKTITTIPATNYNNGNAYSFIDNAVTTNVLYEYRLAITDKTGKVNYSPIRTVKITDAEFDVSVFPNPATDKISVSINGYNGLASISISNSFGQIVNHTSINIEGFTKQNFDLSALPKGIYFIKITMGTRIITKKITHI